MRSVFSLLTAQMKKIPIVNRGELGAVAYPLWK
jgi:hypothetical protein